MATARAGADTVLRQLYIGVRWRSACGGTAGVPAHRRHFRNVISWVKRLTKTERLSKRVCPLRRRPIVELLMTVYRRG
jgi:hypothetical protein